MRVLKKRKKCESTIDPRSQKGMVTRIGAYGPASLEGCVIQGRIPVRNKREIKEPNSVQKSHQKKKERKVKEPQRKLKRTT